jgi:fatty-acyl-CoA synthase
VPLPGIVDEMALTHGSRPALLMDGQSVTYAGLARRMTQFARWALAESTGAGEVVCLLLPNCPDYVAIWLGIISVSGVVALINTNLRGEALLHAIAAVAPKHLIVGGGLEEALEEVHDRLPAGLRIWTIASCTATLEAGPLRAAEQRPPSLGDLALYIYTSGTTGLPKAAKVSHRRVAEWSCWFAGMIDTQPDDRMYNCLPMYHSVGGVVAVGAMLAGGGSVLIRPKFSVSNFWDEIVEGECTLFQYIGELCRYLVNNGPRPRETLHRLRLCCGNGLRGDVWERFQTRFRIPRILEFYASTEGNVSLYNCPGKPGAIGQVPSFLKHRFPIVLARCDPMTGALLRGTDGLCLQCGPDEIGEAIGRICDEVGKHGRAFEGYTDVAATGEKIARAVLAPGDAWFRTGDLMRVDAAGFFYFVDRIGDTFRWKGENVSAEEVEIVLRACPGVIDAVVYGVLVPGAEGRAGMAALVVNGNFDLAGLRAHLVTRLPEYARPLFLRIGEGIAVTSTFKAAKAQLAAEGYDPEIVADLVYVDEPSQGAFVALRK